MTTRRRAQREAPVGPKVHALLRLLANDIRRSTLVVLADSPADVTTLAKAVRRPIGQVSANLGTLRQSRLVTVERDGQQRIYSLGRAVQTRRSGDAITLTVRTRDGCLVSIKLPDRL